MCIHRAERRQDSSSPPCPTPAACCPPPQGRPPAATRGQVIPAQADGPQTESPPKNKKFQNKKGSRYKTYLTEEQRDPQHHRAEDSH